MATSPYLQAHENDLVEWSPWGEVAFQRAREEKKPIFLSIGYSSCHWCKVLQEESFCDPTIAEMINESFVPILVDREEMPHIDRIYMDFAQLLTQHPAGWPLNLILTPTKIPFYIFTYLPPLSMDGVIGLNDVLIELVQLWNGEDQESLLQQTEHLVQIYQEAALDRPHALMTKEDQLKVLNALYKNFDRTHGGFTGEMKFPLSYQASYLVHLSEIFEDQRPLYFAELSLEKQLLSPLFDPIFGGFRRYSADVERTEPHFEKMLSDNAALLEAYAHLYQVTLKPIFKETAEMIYEFITNILQVDFGYGVAQSADHAEEEGGAAIFQYEDLEECLTKGELAFAVRYLGVTKEGAFEGDNIPYLVEMIPEDQKTVFSSVRKKMQQLVGEQAAIEVDQKVLLSTNAQFAQACIKAGYYIQNRDWIRHGVALTKKLIHHFYQNGRLYHSFYAGQLSQEGLLEDYALMIKALLTAFETGDYPESYLVVQQLLVQVDLLFGASEGGYFGTTEKDTHLVRIKPFLDGSEPSGNGIMAENLLRLYGMSHKIELLRQVEAILKIGIEKMTHYATSTLTLFLQQIHYLSKDKKTIFLKRDLEDHANYGFCHPFTSVVVCDPCLVAQIPAIAGKACINNKTTVYLCSPGSCSEPIDDLEKLGVPWNRVF